MACLLTGLKECEEEGLRQAFTGQACRRRTSSKDAELVAALAAPALAIGASGHDEQLLSAFFHGQVLVLLEEPRPLNTGQGLLTVPLLVVERGFELLRLLRFSFHFITGLRNGFCLPVFGSTNHEHTQTCKGNLYEPSFGLKREEIGKTL